MLAAGEKRHGLLRQLSLFQGRSSRSVSRVPKKQAVHVSFGGPSRCVIVLNDEDGRFMSSTRFLLSMEVEIATGIVAATLCFGLRIWIFRKDLSKADLVL